MTEVKLPELASGVTTATISFWHYSEGDTVKKDDDLVELVTDKATFNLPAPVSGRLKQITMREGDTVSVGETIAVIE